MGYVTLFPSQRDAFLACQFPTPTSLTSSCICLGQDYHPGKRWEFHLPSEGPDSQVLAPGSRRHGDAVQLWVGDGTKTPKHCVLAALAQLRLTARQRWPICFPLQRTTDRRQSNVQTFDPVPGVRGQRASLAFHKQRVCVCDQRPPTES